MTCGPLSASRESQIRFTSKILKRFLNGTTLYQLKMATVSIWVWRNLAVRDFFLQQITFIEPVNIKKKLT